LPLAAADSLRRSDPAEYERRSIDAMGRHVAAMLALKRRGAVVFDYGNNLRAQAVKAGVADAFDIPGFVPEYIRPLFCEGKGPFRWAALSGDPADIAVTDRAALEMFAGVPGITGADLLARLRRPRAFRPPHQRAGARRRHLRADRHRSRSP
jgi:urocanate hydratase